MNANFLNAVYCLNEGDYGWTASFLIDPAQAGSDWAGQAWHGKVTQAAAINGRAEHNNYYCVAVMRGGKQSRTKANFRRLAVLLADDVNPEDLTGSAAYVLETSPGKYQAGVLLDDDDPDTRDQPLIDVLLQAMAANGLVKVDSSGNNIVRYARLPVGSNTKARPSGPFQTVMISPLNGAVYSLADAAGTFDIDLEAVRARLGSVPVGQSLAPKASAADLLGQLLHPDPAQRSYHDPLLRISSSLMASGLQPHATLNHLRALGEISKPANDNAVEVARHAERFGPELEHMVAGARKYAPALSAEPLIRPMADLADEAAKTRWIVKGIVPANAIGMIFGASGTFKSFIAFDLVFHVANDMGWAGLRTNGGPVLYVAAEGGGGAYHRAQAWCQARAREIPRNVYVCTTPLTLSANDDIKRLRCEMEALQPPPSLIVIDTLSQTFEGDESASSDVSAYIRSINTELRDPFGATIIIVHHTGHNDGKRPRGSSAITANLDFVLGAFKPSEEAMQTRLSVTKMRDGERRDDLHFTLTKEHLGFDEDGDAITSLVANHEPAPPSGGMVQLSDAEWRRVQDVVSRKDWRKDAQTGADWVGHAFAEALNMNIAEKKQINALINQAIAKGILALDERPQRGGKNVKFVIVGDWIER